MRGATSDHRASVRSAYEWVIETVEADGSRPALSVWRGAGEVAALSRSDLLDLSLRAAAGLRDAGAAVGDRVLVCLPNDESFAATVLGCLAAGIIPVPSPVATITRAEAFRARLRGIADDCAPTLIVTLEPWLGRVADAADSVRRRCPVVSWETLRQHEHSAPSPVPGTSLALLQYTSGSTGRPKGVAITHEALRASCGQAARIYEEEPSDIAVTWVPLHHDMGLITGLFRPLFSGYPTVLLTPEEFVRDPGVWLEAMSRCQGSLSSAPNFAYDLCVQKIDEQRLADWDLSAWRVARNAGEVVRAATMDGFTEKFAQAGFRSSSFCPSYGLAEATLTVTTCGPGLAPIRLAVDAADLDHGADTVGETDVRHTEQVLLSSGVPLPETTVSVIGGRGPWQVGEIAVSGPQMSSGYWNDRGDARCEPGQPVATGDVGFIHRGHLFVLGRFSDRFSYRGRNFYLADIGQACAGIAGTRNGRVVAFPTGSGDSIIAVAELRPDVDPSPSLLADLALALTRRLAARLELYVAVVDFVAPGNLPVTTSGKVRVSAARRQWEEGTLPVLTFRPRVAQK